MCQEVKKVMGSWQYDETDFERLSLIMMLHDLDFTVEEIKKYMKLSLEKNERECLKLLNKKDAAFYRRIKRYASFFSMILGDYYGFVRAYI